MIPRYARFLALRRTLLHPSRYVHARLDGLWLDLFALMAEIRRTSKARGTT